MEELKNKETEDSKKVIEQVQNSLADSEELLKLEELEKSEGGAGACAVACLLLLATASAEEDRR